MTNGRWLLWTAASGIVLALAILTLDNTRYSCFLNSCEGGVLQSAVRQRQAATLAAFRRWSEVRAVEDIAEAVRLLPAAPRTIGTASLTFGSDIPDPTRKQVRDALDAERAARAPWHSRGRVAVVVSSDTATFRGAANDRRWRLGRSEAVAVRVLPPSLFTQGRCVVVIRLRQRGLRDGVKFNPERPLMDACAFVDAFGAPGRAIGAALDSSRWRGARIFTPGLADSVRSLRHQVILGGYGYAALDDVPCLAGDAAACESLITRQLSLPVTWEWYGEPGFLDLPIIVTSPEMYARSLAMLLDAIVAEIGPEAFERLWRSDLPFAEAYRATSGRPLSQLAHESVRRSWGYGTGPRRGFGATVTKSPQATLASVALLVALIGGLVFVTARLTPRRQRLS